MQLKHVFIVGADNEPDIIDLTDDCDQLTVKTLIRSRPNEDSFSEGMVCKTILPFFTRYDHFSELFLVGGGGTLPYKGTVLVPFYLKWHILKINH